MYSQNLALIPSWNYSFIHSWKYVFLHVWNDSSMCILSIFSFKHGLMHVSSYGFIHTSCFFIQAFVEMFTHSRSYLVRQRLFHLFIHGAVHALLFIIMHVFIYAWIHSLINSWDVPCFIACMYPFMEFSMHSRSYLFVELCMYTFMELFIYPFMGLVIYSGTSTFIHKHMLFLSLLHI